MYELLIHVMLTAQITVEDDELIQAGGGEETEIVQAEQITTCDVEEETKLVIRGTQKLL